MQEGRGRAVRSPAVGREGLQAVEEPLDAARVAGGLAGAEEAPDDGEGAGAPQELGPEALDGARVGGRRARPAAPGRGAGVGRGGRCGEGPGRRGGDDGAVPDVVEDGQADRDHVLAEAAVGEARAGAHAGDDVVVPEQVHVAEGLAADRRGRAADGEAVDADGLDVALAALVEVVTGGRAQRLLAQDPVQNDRHGARVAGRRRAGQARERARQDDPPLRRDRVDAPAAHAIGLAGLLRHLPPDHSLFLAGEVRSQGGGGGRVQAQGPSRQGSQG